jgi:hypothetical protein
MDIRRAKGLRGMRRREAYTGQRVALAALVLYASSGLAGSAFPAEYPALFTSEQKALQHCPGDVVVWIDPTIAVYRLKGQKGYAKTNRGAYACKADADRAGAHPAEPGSSQ